MPGFLGEIGKNQLNKCFGKANDEKLITEIIEGQNYYIERRTIRKFENDKVFHEDDRYIVLTEGVILNSLQLIEKYRVSNLKDAIVRMYKENGESFFAEFKGSFSGLFCDKKANKWIVYTNHFGDKQIFYLKLEDRIVFASEMPWIVEYMRNCGIEYTINEVGAYFLLTYGYMLEDYTIIKQIRKLPAGCYMKIENGNFSIVRYFEVDNTPDYTQTEEEIIENIDKLFRKAVKLEFEKDREYGYKHISSLSGGLDSRMTVWVAHTLGYTDQLNVTFSQSNYIDEKVAKAITSDLKHNWVFFSLDNGLYLIDTVEDMVRINYGNVLYSGAAHVNHAVSKINFEKYGLYHTGQIGDVILGTYYTSENPNEQYFPGAGAYSKRLIRKDEQRFLKKNYPNVEVFLFYGRAFNGMLTGNLPVQQYTEVVSPFLDPDFFSYCLRIPLKYRYDHRIYKKWILKKYPEAAKYVWEKIQARITDVSIKILGRKLPIKTLPRKIFLKIFKGGAMNSKWHMNPFDYWYRTNNELKSFMEKYYEQNVHLIKNDKVKTMCVELFEKGNAIEKTQVLTLLAAWRMYFENEKLA
ncbi:asparagine synthase [Thermotoga sp. SG1]|uniref:asparagine synthase n=1 Tax=Thermotoga sp. SG1 TaxID=126739 RepID=UPI000C76E786|nr:asparagine synthase [Thermotoga sp. SG1]PLV56751.1 asparagine synthase [Thermotoga sp. SG1]